MKFSPLFPKKQKEEKKSVEQVLFETGRDLLLLKEKCSVTLQRELTIARSNKKKGIKDSGNYSRIGIAYYSLNIIQKVQNRVRDMTSTRDLYNCMNQMGVVLEIINGISGRIGKLDPKNLLAAIKKMGGDAGGASKDLIATLSALSGTSLESVDTVGIDSLVSVDVIERLISGDDPVSCVQNAEGIVADTNNIMDIISQAIGEAQPEMQANGENVSMADITELLSKL